MCGTGWWLCQPAWQFRVLVDAGYINLLLSEIVSLAQEGFLELGSRKVGSELVASFGHLSKLLKLCKKIEIMRQGNPEHTDQTT